MTLAAILAAIQDSVHFYTELKYYPLQPALHQREKEGVMQVMAKKAQERIQPDGNPREGGSGGGILVVEDDEDIREAFKEALELEGYPVRTVSNGMEALELIRSGGAPDLIFLDMMMPVMTGWQFLELRSSDPVLAPIPIVVVSAAGERANVANIAGFIKKPADLEVVFSHANRHCKARKSA